MLSKPWLSSRTILFNVAVTGWALVQWLYNVQVPPFLMLVFALGNIWLRAITTKPLRSWK